MSPTLVHAAGPRRGLAALRRGRRLATGVVSGTIIALTALPPAAPATTPTETPETALSVASAVLPPPNPGPVPIAPDAQDPPPGTQDTPARVRRVSGRDATSLSVGISREGFPYGSPTVYLARADDLADALVAGQLTDGPILLLPRGSAAPASVRAEIVRLRPTRVVAVGGTAAVSQAMLASAAAGRRTGRIAGPNAYATASAIAREAFGREADGSGGVAYVVSRTGLADGAVSGQLVDGPVLVSPPRVSTTPITGAPSRLQGTVVAIGGPARLPDSMLRRLPAPGVRTQRLAGPDRYSTAALVARRAFPYGASRVYVASGTDLGGAVASGALGGAPVLLTPACAGVPSAVTAEVRRIRPREIVLLGERSLLCARVETALAGVR